MTSTVPHVNLVPMRLRNQRRTQRLIWGWCGAVGVTACLVGIPSVYLGLNAKLSDSVMGGQIERVRSQLATNQSEVPRLQARIAVLEEQRQTLDLVRNRIDWESLFGHIVGVSDSQLHFTSLNATGGGVEGTDQLTVRMKGIAINQTAIRSFVVELESLGIFDKVELTNTRRDTVAEQEVVSFEISTFIGEVPVEVQP